MSQHSNLNPASSTSHLTAPVRTEQVLDLPPHLHVEASFPAAPVPGARSGHSLTFDVPQLVLVRGLPGSGKSSFAQSLRKRGWTHLEANQYFQTGSGYAYNGKRIGNAHAWCQALARRALASGAHVVVANTFSRIIELAPYLSLGVSTMVLHASGHRSNKYNVPDEAVGRMAERWEHLADLADLEPDARTRHGSRTAGQGAR